MVTYAAFLEDRAQRGADHGIAPRHVPDELFDFQRDLVEWSLRKGRAAIFADCGLGKTPMQLTWAQNIAEHTGKPVLIVAPLAVAYQTTREGEKFHIECHRSNDGRPAGQITITNYERLHHFHPDDFGGCVCDESSILKSFDGTRRGEITAFMRKMPYRLLATATAAPNDYVELGTSSEALGYLGHMDMLARFFKNDQNNCAIRRMYGEAAKWRFKGHAELPFWRWVTSWARACRQPSDLGYDNGRFILPPLTVRDHYLADIPPQEGMLFTVPARDMREQRAEKKRTIGQRCRMVADMVNDTGEPAVVWCHLNDEGDTLADMVPDAIQVAGRDSDDAKEDKLLAFVRREARVLITKPKIGAWGLNLQHCAHITYFPSHSFEQYYQAVRRCWRFGQEREVRVDIVLTEGERRIMENLDRKRQQAEEMFSNLVAEMSHAAGIMAASSHDNATEVPSWL